MSQTVPAPGPVTEATGSRAPFGLIEYLRHHDLVAAQEVTLASPTRRHSFAARILFRAMDALYGRDHSLEKFRVLELVARVPYQAWEDHAEHEYALLVQEHPEWGAMHHQGEFAEDFATYDSLADLIRQIGDDERLHEIESKRSMLAPRFG